MGGEADGRRERRKTRAGEDGSPGHRNFVNTRSGFAGHRDFVPAARSVGCIPRHHRRSRGVAADFFVPGKFGRSATDGEGVRSVDGEGARERRSQVAWTGRVGLSGRREGRS